MGLGGGGGAHISQPRAELQSGGLGPPATCAPQLCLAPGAGGGGLGMGKKWPPLAGDIWGPEKMGGGAHIPPLGHPQMGRVLGAVR